MTGTRRVLPTAGLLGLAILMAVPISAAMVAPAAHTPFASSHQWAYGTFASFTEQGSGQALVGSYTYSLTAYFGWQVILTETNTSANVSQLEIQRTMAISLYEDACMPTCSSPQASINLTLKALELGTGFANITTAGVVYEGGSAVPATALLNVSDSIAANVSTSDHVTLNSGGAPRTASASASRLVNATAGVNFSPAFGLYPSALAVGDHWNSTSDYVAHGGWGWSYSAQSTGLNGSHNSGSASGTGSIARNGTVYLNGSVLGSITLSDGSVVNAVNLTIEGPFSVREGVLIVPVAADLFNGGPQAPPPTGASTGTAAYVGTIIDVRSTGDSRFGERASAATVNGASGYSGGLTAAVPTKALAAQPVDQTGAKRLQAQPESVATAQQWSQCLAGQGACPGSLPGVGSVRSTGLILLAFVVVVGLIASAVVIDRRRQTPPAPRPNAGLYPAVGAPAAPVPPPGAVLPRPPPGPAPTEEPDPLGHLW